MDKDAAIRDFERLRDRIRTQSDVDARAGLAARRLIHRTREVADLRDITLVVEASLNAFEQTLLESGNKALIEATRAKCIASIDSLLRRLSE